MNQRGAVEAYAIAGVVIIGMGAALAVQTYRLNSCKAEFAEFKGGVEALGRAAEVAAKAKEAKDRDNKEKADADKKRLTTDLATAVKRLRDANASRSSLSAPGPSAASPNRTCFDATELSSAVRKLSEGIDRFQDGVLGIAAEGNQAVIDLDNAKEWARQR